MRKLFATLIITLSAAAMINAEGINKAGITQKLYGKMPDGTAVQEFTLTNKNGITMKVITLGGIVTEIHTPDKDGKFADICLGCSNLEEYLDGHPFFGAIAGRVANRIAKGKFTLDGKEYTLATNNGPNHLHGGKEGFDKKVWKANSNFRGGVCMLTLEYTSKDGEEGYPGTLKSTVTYILNDSNEWRIHYQATTDKATPINLTQHCYFNLGGHDSGTILDHMMQIEADGYTPADDTLIPTGKIDDVKGTPFDFTSPTAIGTHIKEIKADPQGFDLNYVLKGTAGKLRPCATVTEPKSGRMMTVTTTEPGVQFYTGNFLDGKQKGKGGVKYKQYGGFCLETQHYPDSINHKEFPSVVLEPGKTYSHDTVYTFGVAK
ncbi:MAG TPA: aldose epimerase family protein [Gemmataceae bacterium]|jgi:aldose 1-epimerase|nr:aldose epimerase family protein [Gemmataceae bacterium]